LAPRLDDFQQCLQQAKQLTDQLLSPVAEAAESLAVSAEQGLASFSAETLQEHLDYVRCQIDLAVSSSEAVEVLDRLARLDQLESQFVKLLEQEKLAALKELAYGASHEINNPLANISSRAQTLLREESDPERQRMLATINSQAFRAHEMISDMMLFAKPPQMNRTPVDLRVMVSNVMAELADDAQRQGTALRCRDPQTPIVISVDEIQLAEALKALCRNALESIGMGGEIDVSAEPILPLRSAEPVDEAAGPVHLPGAESAMLGATIAVKDNGPGISDQVRAHLFDPFYSGREAGRGLGFGLSKCWRIVTEHGGQVEVHSTETDGTTFTLRFPAVAGEPLQGEAESPQAEAG
jgi:signal transduction histidine kinase